MSKTTAIPRQTKYCTAIEDRLAKVGHATNADLLEFLRRDFPELSATTVHRATARLSERGKIAPAPPTPDGAKRFDANTEPHDHFMCSSCGLLKDANVKDKVVPILEDSIGDCRISGQLTVSGLCKLCINKEGNI